MTTKEYLNQAFLLDRRIHSKLEQVDSLHSLSRLTARPISDMPGSPNRNIHKLEDIVVKIIDLESEIDGDIEGLVKLKADITHCIKDVDNQEYQLILELRYLCFKSWEEIAVIMNYDVRHVFRLHKEALREVKMP